jgi:hypothetical protein
MCSYQGGVTSVGEVNTPRVIRELNIFFQQVLYSECTAIYVTWQLMIKTIG